MPPRHRRGCAPNRRFDARINVSKGKGRRDTALLGCGIALSGRGGKEMPAELLLQENTQREWRPEEHPGIRGKRNGQKTRRFGMEGSKKRGVISSFRALLGKRSEG